MSTCQTTCPYCGVGCGVTAETDGAVVVRVSGDESHPANAGRLCVKGATLAETLIREGRLLHPSYRGENIEWESALDLVAEKLASTRREHGPGAIAFYLSGQLLTEDYYVANKLMKGFLGSANVDTNSRLCMSAAVASYQRAFGADFVPCSYQDLEDCDLLVMVGSNAAWTHPVIYQRIVDSRKANPDKRIVVIDPRRTATSETADLHLQIAPGSDAFVFAGLLHHLCRAEKIDQRYIEEHTWGFEEAVRAAATSSLAQVATMTGVEPRLLEQFFQLFCGTEKVVTLYSQGVNQSATGTDKCNSIINCHLATGRLGRSGMGPFSITGQPNAMGGREVGGLATQLAAHMGFDESSVKRVETFWDAPDIARQPGYKAVDMFRAAESGEIRFLWIMATNPAVSMPDTAQARRALANCEFVVVSDCAGDTDTAAYADVLLPAMGWGEKDGTVTNSERCISRQRALVPAMGEARPDWWIVTQVAQRMGFGQAFNYQHPAEIFTEHARLSGYENRGSRDLDLGGLADLSQHQYERLQPTYWPCPAVAPTERSIANGQFFTASGRANFVAVIPTLPVLDPESQPGSEPQRGALRVLNTGRLRDQWHTMSRTGRVPRLMRHQDFFSVSINSADAQAQCMAAGELVELHNDCGSVTALVVVDDSVPPQQVFSPIHWNDQFSGNACVNRLIPAVTDPLSGQPQLKYARVSLARIAVSRWGLLLTRTLPVLPGLTYWSRIAVPGGFLTLFATGAIQHDDEVVQALVEGFRRDTMRGIQYQDVGSGDYREVGIAGDRLVYACYLNGNRARLPDRDWLSAQLAVERTEDPARLLAGFDPGTPAKGRLICTCWEVGEHEISRAVIAGACSVERLGEQLRCGTQCGSCIPELKRMLLAGVNEHAA
jgi:assimilatory nitrate reductase catalytic subunit